jgi:hypothetical protein
MSVFGTAGRGTFNSCERIEYANGKKSTTHAEPTPYELQYVHWRRVRLGAPQWCVTVGSPNWIRDHYGRVTLLNRAYANLIEQIGPRAQLGSGVLEARDSLHMIAGRATQLWQAARALKRGRLWQFCDILAIPRPGNRNLVTKPKQAAGLWLEYWMGWAPLASDIHNSLVVVTSSDAWDEWMSIVGRSSQLIVHEVAAGGTGWVSGRGRAYALQATEVRLTNPNAALADRLGVLNPLQIAWEIIPFSFMVDWIVNIGSVVASLSSFAGYSLRYSYNTFAGTYDAFRYQGQPSQAVYTAGPTHCAYMKRTLGIQTPKIQFMDVRLPVTRAATAISLLTQMLRSLPPR